MSDLPAKRRYNEREVSRLLKRAAELQRAAPTAANPTGLTLEELEEIASEAGLDPTMLRRAATELDTGSSTLPSGIGTQLAGAPVRVILERALPFEADESVFDELVPIVQIAATGPGQASQVGRSFTWSSQSQANPGGMQVVVTIRSGETLVRIEERFGGLAGGLFGGIVGGGSGIGIGVGGAVVGSLGSVALAVALPAAVILGTYAAARGIYRSVVGRRKRALEELLERICAELTRSMPGE